MSAENTVKSGKLLINEKMLQEIADFLLPLKRSSLINALAEEGELSQGQLALKIDSSAASLANIMNKFEQFDYKLLEAKSAGKYRLYSLSEIGWAYVRQTRDKTHWEDNSRTLEREDEELLREAEKSIDHFELIQSGQGESWQTKFDEAMRRRTRGTGDELDEESERLVNRYLECLERLTLRGSGEILGKAMLKLKNSILQERVVEYMDCFDSFLPILRQLQHGGEAAFGLLEGLEEVFNSKGETADTVYLKMVGLGERECTKLQDAAKRLKECMEKRSKKEIYQYFDTLLPDCGALSYSIAGWISGRGS